MSYMNTLTKQIRGSDELANYERVNEAKGRDEGIRE